MTWVEGVHHDPDPSGGRQFADSEKEGSCYSNIVETITCG